MQLEFHHGLLGLAVVERQRGSSRLLQYGVVGLARRVGQGCLDVIGFEIV
jgi:hypothetical protein